MPLTTEQSRHKVRILRELATLEAAEAQAPPAARRAARPMRELVLDALDEIGLPCYTQQLISFIEARYGRKFSSTRFGTLSVDEERAHARGTARVVWLAHGLTFDRAEPVKRLWARSDWPLECRVVTPYFLHVLSLRSAARFSQLALQADAAAADPHLLRRMAADHARGLGVKVKFGEFKPQEWHSLAKARLEAVEHRDADLLRQAGREMTRTLSDAELLFGRGDAAADLKEPA